MRTLSLEVYRVAHRMARALRRSGLRCEGVNLFLADGEAAFRGCRTSTCTSFLATTATNTASMRTGGFGTVQGSTLLLRGCSQSTGR